MMLKFCISLLATFVRPIFVALTAMLMATISFGCSWQTRDGTGRTHLVLGIGFITTSDQIDKHTVGDGLDAYAYGLEATGAFVSFSPDMAGLHIGYLRRQTIEIATNAEILFDAQTDQNGQVVFRVFKPTMPQSTTDQHSTDLKEGSKQ